MQASGNYKAIPFWRIDLLAEILAAFHWIEPESIHRAAIASRMLWPRVLLPQAVVIMNMSWYLEIRHHLDDSEGNMPQVIWNECHGILQSAFSTGEVAPLFHRATRAWECLSTNIMASVFVVKDLGDIMPSPDSVLPITDPRARLAQGIIHSGVSRRPPTDTDEYLYMAPTLPNGCGHSSEPE